MVWFPYGGVCLAVVVFVSGGAKVLGGEVSGRCLGCGYLNVWCLGMGRSMETLGGA